MMRILILVSITLIRLLIKFASIIRQLQCAEVWKKPLQVMGLPDQRRQVVLHLKLLQAVDTFREAPG